jgi:hypothetical protein
MGVLSLLMLALLPAALAKHVVTACGYATQRGRSRMADADFSGEPRSDAWRYSVASAKGGPTAMLTSVPGAVADGGDLNITATLSGTNAWPDGARAGGCVHTTVCACSRDGRTAVARRCP